MATTTKQMMAASGRQNAETIEGTFMWLAYHAFPVLFIMGFASLTEKIFSTPQTFNIGLMFAQSFVLELGAVGFVYAGMENRHLGKKKAAKWYLIAGLSITALTLLSVTFMNVPTIVSQAQALQQFKEPVQQTSDTAEAILLLIRSMASLLYGFVEHILRGIASDEAAEKTPAQIQQENDVTKRIDELTVSVQKLADGVHKQASSSVQTVTIDEFEKLASVVYELAGAVDRVHVNVLQINQSTQAYTLPSTPRLQSCTQTVDSDVQDTDPEVHAVDTDALKRPTVPNIEVPGVSSQKVKEVLEAFITGTSWRDIPGNYSRTVKPIREAYELYLQSCTQESERAVYVA